MWDTHSPHGGEALRIKASRQTVSDTLYDTYPHGGKGDGGGGLLGNPLLYGNALEISPPTPPRCVIPRGTEGKQASNANELATPPVAVS